MQKITCDNFTWLFPDGDTHFAGKNKKGQPILRNYQYDRLEAAYHHITDYSVAVDAGAHVGLMTRRLAERFAFVYAFEPNLDSYECLAHNTRDLTNVMTLPIALGAAPGVAGIDRGRGDNSGDVQIDPDGGDIQVKPLDDFDLPDLGLLKIDVQGYEPFVLEGARALLQAHAPVVIAECEPPRKLRRAYSGKEEDPVAAFFAQPFWDYRLAKEISADRIYVPGANGVRPYTKYVDKADYHWQQHDPDRAAGRCITDVAAYINEQHHESILDVGCGDGHVTHMLQRAFGIDDNATALALARLHGVPCVQLSAYRLHHLGRRWDAVTMLDVLEHLPRQERALKVAGAVTDTLYVLNPDPVGTHWHAHEFTESELVEFVTACGWRVQARRRYELSDRNKKTFLHLVKE